MTRRWCIRVACTPETVVRDLYVTAAAREHAETIALGQAMAPGIAQARVLDAERADFGSDEDGA